MGELCNATRQEIVERRGHLARVFGIPLVDAVDRGFSIPPGDKIKTISDSRVGEAEAKMMGLLMDSLYQNREPRRVLSLFDGIGSTSSVIARALPTAIVIGVDNDQETHERGIRNIQNAGLSERVTLVKADALGFLTTAEKYDAIFVDPLWPTRPEGYTNGTFSIAETNPPLTHILPKAVEHSPLVVARVPLITDMDEVTQKSRKFRRELFVDTFIIQEPGGMKTKTVYFARADKPRVSTRVAIYDSTNETWRITTKI